MGGNILGRKVEDIQYLSLAKLISTLVVTLKTVVFFTHSGYFRVLTQQNFLEPELVEPTVLEPTFIPS